VLEPFEDRVADRLARFQNHVADESVADHDLDRIGKQIVPFDVAAEIQIALLQQLENFLREIASFGIFVADRH
jgi:hypothetical protein